MLIYLSVPSIHPLLSTRPWQLTKIQSFFISSILLKFIWYLVWPVGRLVFTTKENRETINIVAMVTCSLIYPMQWFRKVVKPLTRALSDMFKYTFLKQNIFFSFHETLLAWKCMCNIRQGTIMSIKKSHTWFNVILYWMHISLLFRALVFWFNKNRGKRGEEKGNRGRAEGGRE